MQNARLLSTNSESSLYIKQGELPWQIVYRQLSLHNMPDVTSYQVNDNLYIVVPLGKEGK